MVATATWCNASELVVGDEPSEHLWGPHGEARVVGGVPLRQLRLEGRELVEPVGGRLEVGIDVDDGHGPLPRVACQLPYHE